MISCSVMWWKLIELLCSRTVCVGQNYRHCRRCSGGGATSRAKPAALKYCSQHKTVTCSANFYFFGNATQIRWPCRFARELNRRFHQWRDHWPTRAVFCCWRRQIPPLLHVTGCRSCTLCVVCVEWHILSVTCSMYYKLRKYYSRPDWQTVDVWLC